MEQQKWCGRGLSQKMIETMKKDTALMALLQEEDIFLGIRNDYCNIYYHCASMGRVSLVKDELVIETHKKHLYGEDAPKGYIKFADAGANAKLSVFYAQIDQIRTNIKKWAKTKKEKSAQQKLVLANNVNDNAEWFCVDLEYVQARDDGSESAYGRFDIIAVRKKPDENGKHAVAIIELKAGNSAYASSLPDKAREEGVPEKMMSQDFEIAAYNWSLGSGILGHVADFYRFEHRGQKPNGEPIDRYGRLRQEIVNILSDMRALFGVGTEGKAIPQGLVGLTEDKLSDRPVFYFLTLCSDRERESCIKSMKNHLHAKDSGNPGSSIYNVMDAFAQKLMRDKGEDFSNYFFLFHPKKKPDPEADPAIDDILSERYFDKYDWTYFTE